MQAISIVKDRANVNIYTCIRTCADIHTFKDLLAYLGGLYDADLTYLAKYKPTIYVRKSCAACTWLHCIN